MSARRPTPASLARAPLPARRFFLGITGGSGHPYALALARALLEGGHELDLCVTPAGLKVLRHETGLAVAADGSNTRAVLQRALGVAPGSARVRVYEPAAIEAPPSSGTALTGAVILCPCSMGTLARVSAGFSSNLVERAADVALKEGRTLILVPREAPYSVIHLENMLRMARLGAVILPASPGFYHRPRGIDDLVRHVVGKILDRAQVKNSVGARWTGNLAPAPTESHAEPPEEEGTTPRSALERTSSVREPARAVHPRLPAVPGARSTRNAQPAASRKSARVRKGAAERKDGRERR